MERSTNSSNKPSVSHSTSRKTESNNQYDDAALDRYIASQSFDLMLRIMSMMSNLFDGDPTSALVFISILRGNVQHLNVSNAPRKDAEGGVYPDTLRRPVSIQSVSLSLGVPYETARRHIHKLVSAGYVERRGARGFVVPERVPSSSEITQISVATAAAARAVAARVTKHTTDLHSKEDSVS